MIKASDATHESELPFFVRVRKKIEEYEAFVSSTTGELENLVNKSRTEQLSAQETERLIQLDDLVEAFNGRHLAIENHLKRQALEPFHKIIKKAENLIQRIEDEIEST